MGGAGHGGGGGVAPRNGREKGEEEALKDGMDAKFVVCTDFGIFVHRVVWLNRVSDPTLGVQLMENIINSRF